MVWMAISSRGRSSVYFVPSGLGVGKNVYIEECVKKRLVPFIKEYHPDGNYVFWPDLAPAHYANDTQAAFNELGIKFIPKILNPPAVPQLRPIETFWAIFKRKIYENGWSAKTVEELQKRAQKVLRKMPEDTVRNLMVNMKSNFRRVVREGLSVINKISP